MLTLVLGGAASGKSEYAESLAAEVCSENADGRRIYLATMQHGPSAEARIRKHVTRRQGLGFETIEDPLLDKGWQTEGLMQERAAAILLEDIPNLLANRMFSQPLSIGSEAKEVFAGDGYFLAEGYSRDISGKLSDTVLQLMTWTRHLILVSGDIFRDGREYPEETEKYIYCLGELNRRLAEEADHVVEVVCGIPVDHKVHK